MPNFIEFYALFPRKYGIKAAVAGQGVPGKTSVGHTPGATVLPVGTYTQTTWLYLEERGKSHVWLEGNIQRGQ